MCVFRSLQFLELNTLELALRVEKTSETASLTAQRSFNLASAGEGKRGRVSSDRSTVRGKEKKNKNKIRTKTYPDGSTEEWCGDGMRINMMVSVIMVAMMMVSGVRTTSCSRLFGLDRHRRAGLSFPLPKPVPFHAESPMFPSVISL